MEVGCKDDVAVYRPELMILGARGSHFYLHFMSTPIEFGLATLPHGAGASPCGEGRILIVNSIAKWDRVAKQDVMTLLFSMDDSTIQVLQLADVSRFIHQLPHLDGAFPPSMSGNSDTNWDERQSVLGRYVLECAIEATANYSVAIANAYRGKKDRIPLQG
jgi:hypothetical protein